MVRLADDQITAADLQRYIQSYSDFAFEIAALKVLADAGYSCRHAGTYEDPVSKKTREFDIRAQFDVPVAGEEPTFIRLAVECKNVRPNYPMILHRVPRTQSESFIDVVRSTAPGGMRLYAHGESIRLRDTRSPYAIGEYVAKSADQVGKRLDGEIQAADYDVFDRINQASHSAHDLLYASHYAAAHIGGSVISVVIPMLVVPDGRLWAVDYDNSGRIVGGPAQIRHAAYFLDREWSIGGAADRKSYSLSHLDICEIGILGEAVRRLFRDTRYHSEAVLAAHRDEGKH